MAELKTASKILKVRVEGNWSLYLLTKTGSSFHKGINSLGIKSLAAVQAITYRLGFSTFSSLTE